MLRVISDFFWRQFGNPSGWFGRRIGRGMARSNEYDARWTISLLGIQPASSVLEIGFGPGVSSQLASEQASEGLVVGIDHSATMVQAAAERNAAAVRTGRLQLKQGDVASLPYPEASFDIAFSLHSIYFWPNALDAVRELKRVLKPGGLLAITIQPRDKWAPMQQRGSRLVSLYLGPELAALFTRAGLRDVRVESSPNPEKPLECVLGRK